MPDFKQRFRALVATDRQPIRAEAPTVRGDQKTAVLRLYDPIDSWGGPWGVSAKEFAEVLDELPDTTEEIRLHINSPGGEVFDAIAILNALRAHKARVVAVVDGVAASAASFIAAGADELIVARNSEMFVHDAWGLCVGNAADMAKMAKDLDHFSDNCASIYAAKAGGTVEEWRAVMAEETWFSAEQAVEAGLADRVDDSDPADADKAKARFDLSIFASRRPAPAPQDPVTDPVNGPTDPHEGGPAVAFSDEQITHLRQRLGVADDADEATILAALDQTLDEYVDPDRLPSATIPPGHVVVPEARLTDLEAAAQQGVTAATTLREKERDAFLDSVAAKFLPANRAAWEAEYDRNPEETKAHFASAPDILPVAQIGNGGEADLDADDAIYNQLFAEEGAR